MMLSIEANFAVNYSGQGQPSDAKVHFGINARNLDETSVIKISSYRAITGTSKLDRFELVQF